MPSEIMNDERLIKVVWNETEKVVAVGLRGVTKIEAYEENGEMAAVVWLRIWQGDHLYARIRAGAMSEIVYQEPTL